MYGVCSTSAPPPPLDVTAIDTTGGGGAAITPNKRKRRPAGMPDPDAEVVALSPKTLMESDRYVCEICGQGFQRDQNLQMHRRRHKVPWKLLKRAPPAASASEDGGTATAKKRVFVCPEESCLHHDPGHALGDLVGIKKHYRRKHSHCKQWVCARCGKGYAVQSDYKAHLKTCGTRGHSCDCGRVFSRVESFIEHQDTCNATRSRPPEPLPLPPPPPPPTSSPSPSSETNFSPGAWPAPPPRIPPHPSTTAINHNLELQLMPAASSDEAQATALNLSIGTYIRPPPIAASRDDPREMMRAAVAEKAAADEARQHLRQQIEAAEEEFANAKRIRQQSQAELSRAYMLRDQATKQINAVLLQITCQGCRRRFRSVPEEASAAAAPISPPTPMMTPTEGTALVTDERRFATSKAGNA